jgi:hypothetical protein
LRFVGLTCRAAHGKGVLEEVQQNRSQVLLNPTKSAHKKSATHARKKYGSDCCTHLAPGTSGRGVSSTRFARFWYAGTAAAGGARGLADAFTSVSTAAARENTRRGKQLQQARSRTMEDKWRYTCGGRTGVATPSGGGRRCTGPGAGAERAHAAGAGGHGHQGQRRVLARGFRIA